MKSLIRMVAVLGCLLAWRAQCQYQPEGGGSGPYSTPAYSGDFGGTYVSPAYGGGGGPGPAPGAGGATGFGPGAERGGRARPSFEFPPPSAYSTPAFSPPILGLQVSPPVVAKPKPKSAPASPSGSGANAPVKPSGVSTGAGNFGSTATNRLDNVTAPPTTSTNAPAAPGSTGSL